MVKLFSLETFSVIILSFLSTFLVGQSLNSSEQMKAFELLKECVSIPNDSHKEQDVLNNVAWMEKQFGGRGFTFKRLQTETVPMLLLEYPVESEKPTVLFYMHADGQAVDASFWFQDDPYKLILKEQAIEGGFDEISWDKLAAEINHDWRMFGRSVSDAKGPIIMFLAALDHLKTNEASIPYNVKVIIDFEEEIGSPQIPKAVVDYKQDLAADMLVIFDGPRHSTNEPTLTFGARGIGTLTLTVYGPVFPQHSGHYGNYAPNPAIRLAQLLGSMKDEKGRVLIEGYYDGIDIDETLRKELKKVPDDEQTIKAILGVANHDIGVADFYQESLQYPSLNIRGMAAGWVGQEARTIIPSTATAEIDIRLVLESDGDRLVSLVKDHIKDQGYLILDRKPTSVERATNDKIIKIDSRKSYKAFRTDFDTPIGDWLSSAMKAAFGKDPIKIRTSGGSIPISPFVNTLDIPAVTVPTVNKDNNQHSPNENLKVQNFLEGIETMIAILSQPVSGNMMPDEKLVKQAAQNYIDGLYQADKSKIVQSVDPSLTKLGMWYSQEDKSWYGPGKMTYDELVELADTWNKDGGQVKDDSPNRVELLDIESETATAKVYAEWGIDYLHLVKKDGNWQIINILWQSITD
jgi:acetylornithine deacetylase/succinyl-diaminopimelate desuccinylase-like protein